jgi:hypothetical protein
VAHPRQTKHSLFFQGGNTMAKSLDSRKSSKKEPAKTKKEKKAAKRDKKEARKHQ